MASINPLVRTAAEEQKRATGKRRQDNGLDTNAFPYTYATAPPTRSWLAIR